MKWTAVSLDLLSRHHKNPLTLNLPSIFLWTEIYQVLAAKIKCFFFCLCTYVNCFCRSPKMVQSITLVCKHLTINIVLRKTISSIIKFIILDEFTHGYLWRSVWSEPDHPGSILTARCKMVIYVIGASHTVYQDWVTTSSRFHTVCMQSKT